MSERERLEAMKVFIQWVKEEVFNISPLRVGDFAEYRFNLEAIMKQFRSVTVRALSLCLLTVLGASGCMSASAHYKRYRDKPSLYSVLHDQVEQGSTRQHVESLLGSETYKSASHMQGVMGLYKSHPEMFPQGLKKQDSILFYPYDERGLVTLIFRENRLINFNPEKYEKP